MTMVRFAVYSLLLYLSSFGQNSTQQCLCDLTLFVKHSGIIPRNHDAHEASFWKTGRATRE